jgi:hypothetical protein
MFPDQSRNATLLLKKRETADTVASTSIHTAESLLAGEFPSPEEEDNRSEALADKQRILLAEERAKEEQLFGAARLLRSVKDKTLLSEDHNLLLHLAHDVEQAIHDLIGDVPPGWKKQSEVHGNGNGGSSNKRDTLIHYIVDDDARLTCRLETLIEPDLLVPLLSVLNESELYPDWIPSYKIPRMGFDSVRILDKQNRANQVLQVVTVSPWPFSNREVIIQATALDDIDAQGFIGIRLNTLEEEESNVVPPVTPGMERVDFDGAFLFRACPSDHPVIQKSSRTYGDGDDPPILVTFKMYVDAKMRGLPTWIINFITRSAVGQIWNTLLKVAEDVRDGKRPNHLSRIESQADFYGWVRSRIDAMFSKLREDGQDRRFVAYLQG